MDTKAVEDALAQIHADVKKVGAEALEAAKKAGDMSAEQKEKVDGMLMKQGELQEALREVQQKQARVDQGGEMGAKSIGEQVIGAERFKSFADNIRAGQSASFDVKAITLASNSVGQAVVPNRLPGIALTPNRRLTIRDLLMPGNTATGIITYMRESGFTNNAAPVAEGNRKPESSLTMVQVTENAKKIAHFIKASTEALADVPQLRSIIDGRLRYGLALREEAQLLMGTGTGNNLNGIYTQATAFVVPTGAVTPTSALDRMRLALLQTELAEYPADGLVLNPIDWTNIELLKDTTGNYIIGDPQGSATPRLWNRPVVATQAMTVNTFLAGAFGMGAQIFDREAAQVVISTENEADFVENLVTILIEERLALAVYRPECFVKGAVTVA